MEPRSYTELFVCGRSQRSPTQRQSSSCRIDYVNEIVAVVVVAAAAAAVLPSQTAWPAVQTRQSSSTAGMQAD